MAIAMSPEVLDSSKAINNTLTTTAIVRPVFMAHYADASNTVMGIMALVKDILRQGEAEFPRNAHETELRKIVIAASMFSSEILAKVQERFSAGTTRYPFQTVKNVLCSYGSNKVYGSGPRKGQPMGDGSISMIRLSSDEDQPRTCPKPRRKYYLIRTNE